MPINNVAPMPRLIWRLLIAAVSGATTVLAFAPFHAWPVALICLVVLFSLWFRASSPMQAAAIGFAWGLGLFLTGVSWLYVSLHVYGNMPAVMAACAIFLFCCYLSIFPALAGWLQARLRLSPRLSLLIVIPAAFVGSEMLREWFITGFPWLIVGYSQAPTESFIVPLAGYAALFGVFGISWILALTAGVIVLIAPMLSGQSVLARSRQVMMAFVAVIWIAGIFLMSYEWSQPSGKPLTVSLVQGNVPQNLKFRADQLQPTIDNYLELVNQSRGKLIVLPETAMPLFLHQLPDEVALAFDKKARANDGNVLFGTAYQARAADQTDAQFYNGAVTVGRDPSQRYAKQHLVAFGEFVPPLFSWVYQWLQIPLSGFTPGAETQASMRLSGHFVAVNICYEDTFGAEIARPLPDAELLVNISNMAWYGRSLAADQHIQFSQMRALETARWMLRSTNTGVTAAINEKGQVIGALPQFSRGVLEAEAIPRQGITPYVRWRDTPILLLLFVACIFAVAMRRRAAN